VSNFRQEGALEGVSLLCVITLPSLREPRPKREEVYERSLKDMGLKSDGPMTPAQKDLIQRMYRTMVLGESGKRPSN